MTFCFQSIQRIQSTLKICVETDTAFKQQAKSLSRDAVHYMYTSHQIKQKQSK